MVVPSTANGFRAAVSALRSLDGGGCEFPHLHAPGGPLCVASGEEPGQGSGRSSSPWTFMFRESRSSVPAVVTGTLSRTAYLPPLHCIGGAGA